MGSPCVMARATYRLCKYCGDLHDIAAWPANHMDPEPARSGLAGPMIIQDTMQPVQSQLDGRMYDSKSALRSTYKAAGVVEIGNDVKTTPKPLERPKKAEVRASIEKAFSRAGFGA